jgi:hypothetical protein
MLVGGVRLSLASLLLIFTVFATRFYTLGDNQHHIHYSKQDTST